MRTVFIRLILLTVAGCGPAPAIETGWTTTVYVGRHFEVRDHDQPTKYVFNGTIRVAAITGSLSSNTRLQRLRVQRGWNLISLAVTAEDLVGQWEGDHPGLVQAAYEWSSSTGQYSQIIAGQTIGAGAVLWVRALSNDTFGIIGSYSDPQAVQVEAGGAYIGATGLESWSPALPGTCSGWFYRTDIGQWQDQFPASLALSSDLPLTLAPGEAFYVQTDSPVDLAIPDPTLRIRYYHDDHLGSSSVVSDATGQMVEETASYPFGVPRNDTELRHSHEPYQFVAKERDRESELYYFEARYLAAALARFVTGDRKYANPDSLTPQVFRAFVVNPRLNNLYTYTGNNPVRFVDPSGLDSGEANEGGNRQEKEQHEKIERVENVAKTMEFGHALLHVGGDFLYERLATALSGTVAGLSIVHAAQHPSAENVSDATYNTSTFLLVIADAPAGLIVKGADTLHIGPRRFLRPVFDAYFNLLLEQQTRWEQVAVDYSHMADDYKRISEQYNEMAAKLQARTRELQQQTQEINQETERYQQEIARDRELIEKTNRLIRESNELLHKKK